MSQLVGIGGLSNSGKSTSLKYLDPKTTFIISVTPKQLAIPGFRKNYKKLSKVEEDGVSKWVGNYYTSSNADKIITVVKLVSKTMPHVKVLVIDDINYILSMETMGRANEKSWDKHTEIASHYYEFLNTAMNLRDDLYVVLISHIVNNGDELNGDWKLFSTGKMLDRTLNVDGLFNYLLYAEKLVDENGEVEYKFRTRTLGKDTCRSTEGCFRDLYIEPNIKKVIDRIDNYELTGELEPELTLEVKEEEEVPLSLDEPVKEDNMNDLNDIEF